MLWRASVAGGGLPSVHDDEIQIADVDHEPERLAGDEYRVPAIQRIDQKEHTAADREEPERHRDHAFARAFRSNPLHHEAHGEKSLRHESQHDPAVEFDDEDVIQVSREGVEQVSHWTS